MKQGLKQCRSQWARLAMVRACAVLLVLGNAGAGFSQQAAPAKPATAPTISTMATVATPAPSKIATAAPQALSPTPNPAAASALAADTQATDEEETAKPAKAGGEGVKVHGHWKISIANPDGTIASIHEFENSLVTGGGGDQVLAQLLSGQLTWGGMAVVVSGSGGGVCTTVACAVVPGGQSTGAYGNLAQYAYSCGAGHGGNCFLGLTNVATAPPTGASFLTLQGSFTETGSESLTNVSTTFVGCLSSTSSPVSASSCANLETTTGTLPSGVTIAINSFTSRAITGITPSPNQVVTIVVTLSFS